MSIEELSRKLNGIDISGICSNLFETLEREGIVIIYGASDDLVELDGAFSEECGCGLDGGVVSFDEDGSSDDGEEHRNIVKAYWCGMLNGKKKRDYEATWEYDIDIPHATFIITENEEPYCKAVLFYKKDMR